MDNEWKTKPTELKNIPKDVEYLFIIDENGSFGNFKKLVQKYHEGYRLKEEESYFTLTGIIITIENYKKWQMEINKVKNKYWNNGEWFNKKKNRIEKIHFHSSDAFSKIPKDPFNISEANYCNLIDDITCAIRNTEFKVISANIDIKSLIEKYKNPINPYIIGIEFVLERLLLKLNKTMTNSVAIFESRSGEDSPKGDNAVHKKAVEFISTGKTIYGDLDKQLLKRVKGVYFNPKLCSTDSKISYEFIELVDMVTYPIYKSFKSNFEYKRKDYQLIEIKLDNYPCYNGYGLKIFP